MMANATADGFCALAIGPDTKATHHLSVCVGENVASTVRDDVRIDKEFYSKWVSRLSFADRASAIEQLTALLMRRRTFEGIGIAVSPDTTAHLEALILEALLHQLGCL